MIAHRQRSEVKHHRSSIGLASVVALSVVAFPALANAASRSGTGHSGVATSTSYKKVEMRTHKQTAAHGTSPAATAPTVGHVKLGIFSKLPGLTTTQSVDRRESQIGRTFAIDNHYYDWVDNFPAALEAGDVAAGRTPMVTWWGIDDASIINGSQDDLIERRADAVKVFRSPIYIRWAAEMNGNWFAWSGPLNSDDPSLFVQAWRHIHDIFANAGVTNAIWVWAPNADSHPGGFDTSSWNNWRNYYPGDNYVDWVGIDGYNWGTPGDIWQSFGQIFEPIYRDYANRKPIMIAETGSVESGGSKARWVRYARTWIKSHPAVRALCWFDTSESKAGKNWLLDSSSSAFQSFLAMANDPYFSGS